MKKNITKRFLAIFLTLNITIGLMALSVMVAEASDSRDVSLNIPWTLINTCGNQYEGHDRACQAYSFAYCRIILENQAHKWTDYRAKNSPFLAVSFSEAGYTNEHALSKQEVLKAVYDNINSGRPVVLNVVSKDTNGHYVVAVGYKADCNPNAIKESDIIIIDPINRSITSSSGAKENYTNLGATYSLKCNANNSNLYQYGTAKSGGVAVKNIGTMYTVTFDPNGGRVSPATKMLTAGTLLSGMPIPTRSGYTFKGWAMNKINPDSNGVSVTTIVADGVWTFDKDTTLYAFWEKEKHTQDEHTHTKGAYFYSDSHPHYKFYTCETCGEVYTDGSTTNMSSCSVCNLKPTPTYTVTFDPGYGECNISTMQTNAEGKLSSLPIANRDNCTFGGWIMLVGSKQQDVDTNTVFTKNTNVHAVWIYRPCTVFFDANGGTVSQDSKIVTAGTMYGNLPTPSRNGYKFDGWYTKASEGIRMTSNTIVESTVDHTLYAHWTANPTQTTWGTWSAWSSTPYSASSTRQVETRQVKVSDAYTEYRYGLWRNTNNASWCPDYGASLSSSGGSWYESYSSWSKTRMYRDTGHNAFCSGRNHNHTHVAGYDSSGQAYWDIYSDDGTFTGWGRLYYYWEETRTIPAVYETQYRYRDLIST